MVKFSCKFQSGISALFIVQVNMSVEKTSHCARVHSQLLGEVESLIMRVYSGKKKVKQALFFVFIVYFLLLSFQLTGIQSR